ncbi:zinc-binding alcohol dehydrogenase family protein [Novosphingobium piscinae]|uniref:Zinc-binding alcohol dehydrogenase family protein n=1 Tax=Novosphingobium piscinae TaxID=1507448 RepID=A0A7X1FZ00_9SPHN|nr:zinc-binding alcohol dehydrogenase family protein [Novosphingobium piscinae]MBC2669007.1 zinc-binding alcohol dehydrogenase family protein [Novosphingobium piscinae]
MRAAVYRRNGGPEVFELVDLPSPDPGPGEVLVDVAAISIEGGDILARRNTAPGDPPRVKGYAAAGRIAALGARVTGWAIGDAVTTFAFEGSHAERRVVPATHCWRVPDGVGMEVAAAAVITFGTAALALRLAGFASGQEVLVTGAAGGVGIATIQLVARGGGRAIGTGSNPAALAALTPFGLDTAIDLGAGPFDAQLRALGSAGVDSVIDNVGGHSVSAGLAALRDGGALVLVGLLDRDVQRINPVTLLLRRLTVTGCFLGPIIAEPANRAAIDGILQGLADGSLVMPIDRTYPLAEVVAAHTRAEERGRMGRVVLLT